MVKMFFVLAWALIVAAPANSQAATTVKIYPTDDGQNQLYDDDNQTVWSAARNFSGVLFRDSNTISDVIATRADSSAGGRYRIYRSSSVFDTSILPDDAEVTSVKFVAYKSPGNNHGQKLVLTPHRRDSLFNLSRADWSLSHYGAEFSRGPMALSGYNTFGFNLAGVNYINPTGHTIIGGLQDNDYDNIDIASTLSGAAFYSSEAPGTEFDPYLEITYEVPEPEDEFPRYTQIESPYPSEAETAAWADDVYANGTGQLGSYPCGLTVAQCGCALTSLVMSARNADITEDILGDDVNPGNMNAYLSDIDGYASGGALRWLAAQAYFGEFTGGGKIASRFSTPVQRPYGNVMSFIDTALTNPKNAVLAYKNGHFVWLPEKTVNTYTVRDPWWYNTMTADDNTADKVKDYNNVFEDARVLTIADEPVEFTGTDIEVHLQGTAELLFKKATGQKVGYDNGTVVVGLDKASYGNTEIVSLGGAPLSGKGKHLIVYEAGSTFTLDVVGTGTGSYQLEFFTISATGEVTTFEFSGQTLPGLTTTFNFDLTTGTATEQPITYEQFLRIVNTALAGATDQEKKFFLKWTEKIFNDLEKKTATQAIQSIQVYKKLLVAKKIQAPTLPAALDLLQLEVQRR